MASTGKIVEVLFENAIDTYEHQDMMLNKVSFYRPDAADMQNSGNFIWRSVQQHAPIIDGFDLTGLETNIIEETYPAILGTPKNDFVEQRADDMRDTQFWERRGKQSGMQQATELNKQITSSMVTQAGMFYSSSALSGYPFISEAQALMNERQGAESMRYYMLNDRDNLTFSADLAARQTLQGRPESDAWTKGQIGANVAGFDVFTGSFLPNITGGAASTAVTGGHSFAPEGGSVDPVTGVATNVDYRSATIAVTSSASFDVGDKVTLAGVNAVGLADKTDTGVLMTFTVVAKPSGTSITVYPKPIAVDDGALSVVEAAYANVSTVLAGGESVDRVNTDASNKTNLFWDKDAVEVLGGTIPAQLFKQFDGMQVISKTMSNGQSMYCVYDGDIAKLTFRFRLFTWYGITVKDPSRVGVSVTA